jgi:ankyrin repeat protein
MNDQARLPSQDLKANMDSFGVSGLMRAILERRSCREIAPLALAAPDIDRFFTLPIPARLNPLCCAILTGQPAQTELLLSLGARLDVRDMQWNTPLHLACLARQPDIVGVLLERRAPRLFHNARHKLPADLLQDAFGRGEPVWDAIRRRMLDKLRDEPSDLEPSGERFHAYRRHGMHTDRDKNGNSVLLRSCALYRLADRMVFWIEDGADLFASNANGQTVLHCAVASQNHLAKLKALPLPILEELVNVPDACGMTPLHYAPSRETATFLVRHGADIEASDCWGRTPVCTAASERTRLFLAKIGANLSVQAQDGRTPLHFALDEGCTTFAAREFIRLGADAGVPDAMGNTPLHYADSPSQAAVLIDKGGADPNRSNNYGETPLEYQKRLKGSGASVTRFLRGKARPSARPVPELAP